LFHTTLSLNRFCFGKSGVSVAAGLGITLRTSAAILLQLKWLDGKYGLPPLHVNVCLHAGSDLESLALKQLRRTVTDHALVALAGGGAS
jgi:hypothetical protein